MINVHAAVLIIIYWHRTRCFWLCCRNIAVWCSPSDSAPRECLNFNAFQFSRTDFISQEVFYWLLNDSGWLDSSIKHKSLSRKVGHGLSAADAEPRAAFVGGAEIKCIKVNWEQRSSQQAAHVCDVDMVHRTHTCHDERNFQRCWALYY